MPQDIVLISVVMTIALPFTYLLGWMFSRGYHRGKREFLHKLLIEHGKD